MATGISADLLWKLSASGRIFVASDADQNDLVTGQTSFANTTPTFLLDVPVGTIAVPLSVQLMQTGTVGGDIVNMVVEVDDAKRYSTGGTAETIYNPNKSNRLQPKSTLYSGATASAGYGIRLSGRSVGQDVSPAEGALNEITWKPDFPIPIEGQGSLLIYTYAGTTGPTVWWSITWAEMTTQEWVALAGSGLGF